MHAAKVRPSAPASAGRPDATLLVRLRRDTADAHRRVEARLFPSALADRHSYARMLRVLLGLHEPLESRLSALPELRALGIEVSERRKAPRLRADLAALGDHLPPPESRPDPFPADLPEALGAFYVLEGSTLGGRVLLGDVRTRLGHVPTSFLAGYGDDTGRFWRRTRAALVEGVRADADPSRAADRLIAGAGVTFARLERLLDDEGWVAP